VAQINIKQDTLFVEGEMTFSTVAALLEASKPLLAKLNAWNWNFSQVTTCDSAGCALLLEWQKWAKHQNKPLQFSQLPLQAKAIAAAAGLSF
jgi:ABC-type transporter Mla MlaB component